MLNNKSPCKSQDLPPKTYNAALALLNGRDSTLVPRACEVIDFGASRLRIATHNAIRAYGKSGALLNAALTYAAFGLPVFPLDVASKKPIPRRERDPSGQFKDGIPGTGGFKKATTDPLQIIAWWRDNPKALIGLPMGERSGVWCLDIDTSEDHADGVAGWNEIAAQHDPIVTREHRSATGGPHLIFNWHAELPLGCSAGALPDGISVKGQGGYIVAPPSRRKGRVYRVHNDIDPIDPPAWLTDLILQGRSPSSSKGSSPWDATSFPPV